MKVFKRGTFPGFCLIITEQAILFVQFCFATFHTFFSEILDKGSSFFTLEYLYISYWCNLDYLQCFLFQLFIIDISFGFYEFLVIPSYRPLFGEKDKSKQFWVL